MIHLWGLHDAKQDCEIPTKFPERRNENIEAVVFTPDSQTVLAFIPKFEKSSWLDRLWVQSDVDSFHHVGTLAVSHTLSRNVTMPILDTDLLFSRACFCPDTPNLQCQQMTVGALKFGAIEKIELRCPP